MSTELSPIQQSAHAFHQLIDGSGKGAAVDLTNRTSIRDYAVTLSHAGRAHLKAVITL